MHSIMCFHSVRSASWQSSQCNQCLCVRCCFSLFNISLPYCLTSFRLAINSFISSFSSSFLATACGSSFPPTKDICCQHVLGHRSPLRRSRATDLLLTELHVLSTAPSGDCDLRSGFKWFSCTSPRCSLVSSTSVFLIA